MQAKRVKNRAIVRSLGDTGTTMAPSLCWDFKLSNEGSFVEIGQEMTKLGSLSSATDEAPGRNVFSICPLLFFLVLYSPFCLSSCLLKKYHVFTNNNVF